MLAFLYLVQSLVLFANLLFRYLLAGSILLAPIQQSASDFTSNQCDQTLDLKIAKVARKGAKAVFYVKRDVLKYLAQKLPNVWTNFVREYVS